MVSIPDIDQWSPEVLLRVFQTATNAGSTLQHLGDDLDGVHYDLSNWGGYAADSWRAEHGKVRTDIDEHHGQTQSVATIAQDAAQDIRAVKNQLEAARGPALKAGMQIAPDGSVSDPNRDQYPKEDRAGRDKLRQETETALKAVLASATVTEQEIGDALRAAVSDTTPVATTPTSILTERQRNQVEAFRKMFGSVPTTPTDWQSAAALDPHSYNPNTKGVPPNIVVGKIKPVPGQGVLQTDLFIPGGRAWSPSGFNAGDGRQFDPKALPDNARVSMVVDYERGVIIARQNPSINLDTGEVRTGTPDISATQRSDGAVLIKYNAADPFSPGGEGMAKALHVSVRGDLAFQPAPGGPQVGGHISSFPSVEVNHFGATGQNASVLSVSPLITENSMGPLSGLPIIKDVGDPSLVSRFDGVAPLPSAQVHLPSPPGGMPVGMPAMPPTTIAPPITTTLGPITSPPTIGINDPINVFAH